ncbi:hypothetical protein SHAb15599_00181 [Acinetobacter phage SH-Ab 15599]|nr:hypothetical protein SHAb15599_00181 [Acinetobacter phage SH-Ab 15599]
MIEKELEESENPFGSVEAFSKAVEDLVWAEDITYSEALSLLVEEHQIDYHKVKNMVAKLIIDKIEAECVEQRILKVEQTTISLKELF